MVYRRKRHIHDFVSQLPVVPEQGVVNMQGIGIIFPSLAIELVNLPPGWCEKYTMKIRAEFYFIHKMRRYFFFIRFQVSQRIG